MKLYFVTSNSGKVATLKNHLSPLGVDVIQEQLDLIEPQADTGEEVALSKAAQAFSVLKKPLVVDDSSFVIDNLSGFPGPYIKFVLKSLGAKKLAKMAHHLRATTCRLESSLIYISPKGDFKSFVTRDQTGRIASEVDETFSPEAWSDLWRIFIPKGSTKTLSALTFAQREAIHTKHNYVTCYGRFANWISHEPLLS